MGVEAYVAVVVAMHAGCGVRGTAGRAGFRRGDVRPGHAGLLAAGADPQVPEPRRPLPSPQADLSAAQGMLAVFVLDDALAVHKNFERILAHADAQLNPATQRDIAGHVANRFKVLAMPAQHEMSRRIQRHFVAGETVGAGPALAGLDDETRVAACPGIEPHLDAGLAHRERRQAANELRAGPAVDRQFAVLGRPVSAMRQEACPWSIRLSRRNGWHKERNGHRTNRTHS